jgi:hypothetical protein
VARSSSATETSGRSRGHGASHDSSFLPLRGGTRSSSRDASYSVGFADSESITEGINSSTAWGISTSRAITGSESLARSVQRSREFLVEQHELQQLPASAMIVTYSAADGRRVVAADANPAILGLPTASLTPLDGDGAGQAPGPDAGPGHAPPAPVSWRTGEDQPPPNLGPPPERLDWRRDR